MPIHTQINLFQKYQDKFDREEPIKGQIVFYGPSYFTRWGKDLTQPPRWDHKPLREVLLGKSGAECCINRGFGGSCPEHQLYHYHDMIKPLAPKILVYGSWGNGPYFGYTDEESLFLAERVVAYARADFPDMPIYLMGAPFTVAEADAPMESRVAYSQKIRELAEKTPNCHFFDPLAYKPLWDPALFVEDGIHYNQKGYDVFADYFREILKNELDQF